MNKEEFLGKLQMTYIGDRNAFNEIVSVYDDLQNRIDKAIEYIKPRFMNRIDNDKRYFENYDIQQIYEILKGDDDE